MPFQLEDGSGFVIAENTGELWLENDVASSGIKWPRCCCAAPTLTCEGVSCPVCGGVRLGSGGSITDDNGTWSWLPALSCITSDWAGAGFPSNIPDFCTDGITGYSDQMFDYGQSPCYTSGTFTYKWAIKCRGDGTIRLALLAPGVVEFCSGILTYDPGAGNFIQYQDIAPSCSDTTMSLTASWPDYTDIGFTSLSPPSVSSSVSVPVSIRGYLCCQEFIVHGCNGGLLSGATVTVYSSLGGTQYAQGITASDGTTTLFWNTSCTVYVTVTLSRFTSYGLTNNLIATTAKSITLTAGTGYTCLGGCTLPLANTLHATWSVAGEQTFSFSSGHWTSSFTASGQSYVVALATNGSMTITRGGTSCGTITYETTSCPPSYSATITPPTGDCLTELGTATITE